MPMQVGIGVFCVPAVLWGCRDPQTLELRLCVSSMVDHGVPAAVDEESPVGGWSQPGYSLMSSFSFN